jgi:DNA excision repair protein ERCC-4
MLNGANRATTGHHPSAMVANSPDGKSGNMESMGCSPTRWAIGPASRNAMNTHLLRIVQDSREQSPFSFCGIPVEVTVDGLEAGDYSLRGFERRIAVERKELQNLVGCLSGERDRFERELARLRGYDCAAVVVEAPAYALRTGHYRGKLDAGAAWQSVLAFSMRYRIPFIFCADRADAEAVTYDLLRHYARDRWRELQALAPAERGKGGEV